MAERHTDKSLAREGSSVEIGRRILENRKDGCVNYYIYDIMRRINSDVIAKSQEGIGEITYKYPDSTKCGRWLLDNSDEFERKLKENTRNDGFRYVFVYSQPHRFRNILFPNYTEVTFNWK